MHIYYLQHFYVVFLSGKRSCTRGVSQNPKVNVSFTVGRREVDTKRLRALGMHTTHTPPDELPGWLPSPVIDSLVPLGSNTGICWPRKHHLLSCSQQSFYFIPAKKRGKEKKKKKQIQNTTLLSVSPFAWSLQRRHITDLRPKCTNKTKRWTYDGWCHERLKKHTRLLCHLDKNRAALTQSLIQKLK